MDVSIEINFLLSFQHTKRYFTTKLNCGKGSETGYHVHEEGMRITNNGVQNGHSDR